MNYPVIVLGAGGHAKVLIDTLLEQGVEIIGAATPDTELKNIIKNFSCADVELVNGIGSVGSTSLRQNVYDKFKNLGYRFRNVIHTSAVISDMAKLEWGGVEVMAGVVINAGTVIDENTIINTRACIDHDCRIGRHVHIAPGTILSGGITIGDGTHIGSGSTIIQGVSIGKGNIIGAGSLVIRDIGDNSLAYGVPAVIRKNLAGEQ